MTGGGTELFIGADRRMWNQYWSAALILMVVVD